MSVFPTQLYDTTLGEPVDAEIHTELGDLGGDRRIWDLGGSEGRTP